MVVNKREIGRFGECIAEKYLSNKGYQVIEKNIQVGRGEIDILANFKSKMIFIEVKTSQTLSMGGAELALSQAKIKNLKKTLIDYFRLINYEGENYRFDLIAVDLNRLTKTANIKHYKDILY